MATGTEDGDVTQLRRRRDQLQRREALLSYERRLLQGQLDILGAGPDPDLAAAVSDRAGAPGARDVRAVSVEPPDGADEVVLEDITSLDEAGRVAVVERITERERAVSSERREVLDELDETQERLVAHYRDRGVDVATLLGGA